MSRPRILPLATEELDDRQKAFLAPFTDAKGRYPNIFGVLCRNMPLMEAWRDFGLYTMRAKGLDPVLREVLILRTAQNSACDYEWHHHARIAMSLGIDEARLVTIKTGQPSGQEDWDLMVQMADELSCDHRLSDATWVAAQCLLGEQGTLDAVFVVGAYTALAMGLNSAGVTVEGRTPPAPQT